jgi:hypothetical protein
MATVKTTETVTAIKLPVEMRENIKSLQPSLAQAKLSIASLKKLGMDTTELEEKLAWGEKTIDVLLSEFG